MGFINQRSHHWGGTTLLGECGIFKWFHKSEVRRISPRMVWLCEPDMGGFPSISGCVLRYLLKKMDNAKPGWIITGGGTPQIVIIYDHIWYLNGKQPPGGFIHPASILNTPVGRRPTANRNGNKKPPWVLSSRAANPILADLFWPWELSWDSHGILMAISSMTIRGISFRNGNIIHGIIMAISSITGLT